MARAYSNDLRRKVLQAYDEGEDTLEELAEQFRVSLGWAKKAAGSLAQLLAGAEAQTDAMVVPGRIPSHLPSSHYSPSRVVCVPTCCPAGEPSESGSSA